MYLYTQKTPKKPYIAVTLTTEILHLFFREKKIERKKNRK